MNHHEFGKGEKICISRKKWLVQKFSNLLLPVRLIHDGKCHGFAGGR
jgi:hypothetical protein